MIREEPDRKSRRVVVMRRRRGDGGAEEEREECYHRGLNEAPVHRAPRD